MNICISFYLPFWHTFLILDDVKIAELSNNSFKWKNVAFWGSKRTLTPPAHFRGSWSPTAAEPCETQWPHMSSIRHPGDCAPAYYWRSILRSIDSALVRRFNDNALYKFTFCTIHYAIVPLKQAVYCVASLYGGIMTDPSAVYVRSLMVWPAWHEQWPTIRRMSPEKNELVWTTVNIIRANINELISTSWKHLTLNWF